jgi:hypothetical protein
MPLTAPPPTPSASNPPALALKPLSQQAIPRALEKAERYRLLNEPVAAESICLDILRVDPENQEALVTLLLALTDQFGQPYKMSTVQPGDVIAKLKGDYEKAYYAGIVAERKADAILRADPPGSSHLAHDLLMQAMRYYESAAEVRPAGNDDALLRWNTCARMIESQGVQPRGEDVGDLDLE